MSINLKNKFVSFSILFGMLAIALAIISPLANAQSEKPTPHQFRYLRPAQGTELRLETSVHSVSGLLTQYWADTDPGNYSGATSITGKYERKYEYNSRHNVKTEAKYSGRVESADDDGPTSIEIEIVSILEGPPKELGPILAGNKILVTRTGRDIKILEPSGVEPDEMVKRAVMPFLQKFLDPSLFQKFLHEREMAIGDSIDLKQYRDVNGTYDVTPPFAQFFGLDPQIEFGSGSITFEKIETQEDASYAHFAIKMLAGPLTGENKTFEQGMHGVIIVDMSNLLVTHKSFSSERTSEEVHNPDSKWDSQEITLSESMDVEESIIQITR